MMMEQAKELASYYTDLTGANIMAGAGNMPDELWIKSNRTYDMEYFETIEEADRRLRQLYQDVLPDDGDYSDPYEGL